jgi:gliding motility-associated-like protein
VNDAPSFVSIPTTLVAINEAYAYNIVITDIESQSLPITATAKPAWLTLTAEGNNRAKLAGMPAVAGSFPVTLVIADGDWHIEQSFTLIVNTRPVVSAMDVAIDEDTPYAFNSSDFTSKFKDADGQAMASMLLAQKPGFGKLFMAEQELNSGDTIASASLGSLIYKPNQDYAGTDVFFWKGSDGYHFSAAQAAVNITIHPVNDAPVITLDDDTLSYEVNGEAALIAPLFEVTDADNDSLTQAEIGFRDQNYSPEFDILLFQNRGNIRGFYDGITGKLSLTGLAPIEDYREAIRSIQYNHLNTLDPVLDSKILYFTASDGKLWSDPKEKVVTLKYTFIDLEIPNGFTPNGDQANDQWIITRPGGLDKLQGAEIKVFNKRGVQVFRTEGFDRPWDGTANGEALPADSYFFTIDLKLKSKKTYKGIVTILR